MHSVAMMAEHIIIFIKFFMKILSVNEKPTIPLINSNLKINDRTEITIAM